MEQENRMFALSMAYLSLIPGNLHGLPSLTKSDPWTQLGVTTESKY